MRTAAATLWGKFQTGTLFPRLSQRYATLFSVEEIETQPILKWYFGATLVFLFLVFNLFLSHAIGTVEQAARGIDLCWPYFPGCTSLYFLHSMAGGYSQSVFYMCLYTAMVCIVWCMWQNHWRVAHALLGLLVLWEIFVIFVLVYQVVAPYYYYNIFLAIVLLLFPYKEYFLKLVFIFLYFMSVTVKLDTTWVLGTYFSSLKAGLPLIPNALIPLATNIVIFSQIVGCWFLLSKNRLVQRITFGFFLFFHIYSGMFVHFTYPTTTILPVIVLFGPLYRYTATPFRRGAIFGWLFILAIALFQLLGFIIPGDRRLTLEGDRFGMFMFEANHQCIIRETTYSAANPSIQNMNFEVADGAPCTSLYCRTGFSIKQQDGMTVRTDEWESGSSLYRCDPYEWLTRAKIQCKSPNVDHVSLQLDHSINGGPFYRIVDAANACDLTYHSFVHNYWIRTPPDAPIVGYPVEDVYQD